MDFVELFCNNLSLTLLFVMLARTYCQHNATVDNFYQTLGPGTNRVSFQIKPDSTYGPTCGWRMSLTSETVINDITSSDVSPLRLDSFSYQLTALHIANTGPYSAEFFGVFNGPYPKLTIWWTCVCNQNTNGTCLPVQGASPVQPGRSLDVSLPRLASSFVCLMKQADLCYTGGSYKLVTNILDLLKCGVLCLEDLTCSGVNFRKDLAKCELIHENNGVTGIAVGCEYYKVMSM